MGMPLGIQVEVAAPGGDSGMAFSEKFFEVLEKKISTGRTYRGKVISLELAFDYTGRTGNVKVHRLRPVRREEVILPDKTIDLLESNLAGFIAVRGQRRSAQLVLQSGRGKALTAGAVDAAIEQMVIVGGSLNLRLLGASDAIADTSNQVSRVRAVSGSLITRPR